MVKSIKSSYKKQQNFKKIDSFRGGDHPANSDLYIIPFPGAGRVKNITRDVSLEAWPDPNDSRNRILHQINPSASKICSRQSSQIPSFSASMEVMVRPHLGHSAGRVIRGIYLNPSSSALTARWWRSRNS